MSTFAELSDQLTALRAVHKLVVFVGECAQGTETWTVQVARGGQQVALAIAEDGTVGVQDLLAPALLSTVADLTGQIEGAIQIIGVALATAESNAPVLPPVTPS